MPDCPDIAGDEQLTRYVFQSNQLSGEPAHATYRAFMPDGKDNETSVFRTEEMHILEIWDLGDREVAPVRGFPIIGRATTRPSSIASVALRVEPDEPPTRHAAIRGWPVHVDPTAKKTAAKAIAMRLAALSEAERR